MTLTAVEGIKVGHFTLAERPTGCTVVLIEDGRDRRRRRARRRAGTRETDLLNPSTTVRSSTRIALSGGSAFGLDAGDGVMR